MDISKNVTNKKQLLYVEAYEKIERQISENYQHGDKLPAEHELAAMLSISRGTLRQALALLREDGRIYNHQGKGNFVIGKEAMRSPLNQSLLMAQSSNIVDYTDIQFEMTYTPASEKMMEVFSLETPGILLNLWVNYLVQEEVAGCALILMPYDLLREVTSEFDNAHQIYEDIMLHIKQEIVSVDTKFNAVSAREAIVKRMNLSEGTPLLHMNDVMFDKRNKAALYISSYYFCDYYDFRMKR